MPVVTIHLERSFDASHVIPGHPGKCGRLHGHTYRAQVWLRGPVGEDGMVVDFYDVKELIDRWDHRHLNDEVEFVPTAELLAADLHSRLVDVLRTRAAGREGADAVACRVRLWETASSYAQAGVIA
jgi:6-pyruvoyltetrahydropterin/6-carboxytetrahydropterin synthase